MAAAASLVAGSRHDGAISEKERPMNSPSSEIDLLNGWAQELGCSAQELLSALGEAGRSLEFTPTEQIELDLAAPA
jgi:hypothetical protein